MNENTEIDPTYDRINLRPAYGIDLRQTFSAMVVRDVCVLTFSTPSTTSHFHLDRSSLTEIWEMLANRQPLVNGEFVLPDAPGFGWELDEDFIAQYRVDK
jgi:L-alanine-DL-glutamate epimerase-like enolase superfamily enzyme